MSYSFEPIWKFVPLNVLCLFRDYALQMFVFCPVVTWKLFRTSVGAHGHSSLFQTTASDHKSAFLMHPQRTLRIEEEEKIKKKK